MRSIVFLLIALAVGCGVLQSTALAQTDSTKELSVAALDEVLITGDAPGPSLWKVSKGRNVLWLLPVLSPLPEKMTWRPKNVEAVIGNSQEVIAIPRFVSSETKEYRQLIRDFTLNSAGKTLFQVLPRGVDEQFLQLADTYAANRDFRPYRPYMAMQELHKTALERSGLSSRDVIGATLQRLAKQRGVNYRQIELNDGKAAGKIIKEVLLASETAEIECVTDWLPRFERDLRNAKVRANAWARGDVEALREDVDLYQPKQPPACEEYFSASKHFRQRAADFENLRFKTLEIAVRKNRSTVALMEIERLLDPKGLLAKFRARGYTIEEP